MTENICDMKVNKQLVYRSGIDDGSLYGDLIDRDALYGRNVGSAKVYGEGLRYDILYSSDGGRTDERDEDPV